MCCCSSCPAARAWPALPLQPGLREGRIAKPPPSPPGRWVSSAFSAPRQGAHPSPQSPRGTKPAAEPYLSHQGPTAPEPRAWPASIYCLHLCRPLGRPACCLPWRSVPPSPSRPSLDPARTDMGPSAHSRELSPAPPLPSQVPKWCLSGPGLDRQQSLSLLLF